jgi:hypothetical protein
LLKVLPPQESLAWVLYIEVRPTNTLASFGVLWGWIMLHGLQLISGGGNPVFLIVQSPGIALWVAQIQISLGAISRWLRQIFVRHFPASNRVPLLTCKI